MRIFLRFPASFTLPGFCSIFCISTRGTSQFCIFVCFRIIQINYITFQFRSFIKMAGAAGLEPATSRVTTGCPCQSDLTPSVSSFLFSRFIRYIIVTRGRYLFKEKKYFPATFRGEQNKKGLLPQERGVRERERGENVFPFPLRFPTSKLHYKCKEELMMLAIPNLKFIFVCALAALHPVAPLLSIL